MPDLDTLWISAAAVLFVGLVTALAGHRPLATAGPRCRRCGYDLTGTPDTTHRCPECGVGLAGNLVAGGTSESDIIWRRRFRRGGHGLLVLASLIALTTAAVDPRRVAITPTWWLVTVEAPIAARTGGDGVGWTEAVYANLSHRLGSCNGSGDAAAIRTVVDPILDRIDHSTHGGRWGRTFLLFAWDEGVVTDAELAEIESIWPRPEIVLGPGSTVDGPDLLQSLDCPFDAQHPSAAGLWMRGTEGVGHIGDRSWTISTRSRTSWPRIDDSRSRPVTDLWVPTDGSLELAPGVHRVEIVRRFELVTGDDRVIGRREMTVEGTVDIPEPAPLPRLVDDATRLAALAEDLRTSSWATRRGDGRYEVSLALPVGELLAPGTPRFQVVASGVTNDPNAWPMSPQRLEVLVRSGTADPRRSMARRPVGDKASVRLLPGFPAAVFIDDDATEPESLTIRMDTTRLSPRLWRALLATNPNLTAPDDIPSGVVEFEIPVVDGGPSDPREGSEA